MEAREVAEGRVCSSHDGFVKWMERLEGKLDKVAEALTGNGKPGLNERVRLLEETRRRDAEEEAREEARRAREDAKREGRLMVGVRVVAPYLVAAAAAAVALLK